MRRPFRRDGAVAAILVLALLVRLAVAAWPVLGYPDELWQYLEPARHIAVGRWIETWDFRAGLRSWLLPALLAGPMAIGHALAPLTRLDILAARLVAVAVSMLAVGAAIGLGRGVSRQHGLVAGIVAATWFEIVYLAPRTLAEPIASGLALVAAYLLARRRGVGAAVLAGLVLGLACAIRVQMAPALAVLAIGAIGRDLRRWRAAILGGLVALCLSAAADAAMGAVPLRWIVRNVAVNLVEGKAASFGVQPWWWYARECWALNGPGSLMLAALALVGARRYPVPAASALANLVVHSLIAHKEYRFVYYTLSVGLVLAAIGSVDLWNAAARGRAARRGRAAAWLAPVWLAPVWLAPVWIGWSAAAAILGTAAATWGVNGRLIAAWRVAGAQPGACGVAVYALTDKPIASYALLSRDVPIYHYAAGERGALMQSRAFDVAMTREDLAGALPGFTQVSCDRLRYFCVFRRPGGCAPAAGDAAHDANLYLMRQGG